MSVTIVAPWYGEDIPGGAEKETRDLVHHLSQTQDVEIVTTCIRDHFSDWSTNYHTAGTTNQGRVTVRRFPVIETDRHRFHSAYTKIQDIGEWEFSDETDYIGNFFDSPELFDYLSTVTSTTFFVPYFMPTTIKGVPLVRGKSYIIACLHDEPYARMVMVDCAIQTATGVIFHVHAEKQLAQDLYGLPEDKCHVFGEGIGMDIDIIRQDTDPYFLYVGKIEKGKNVDQLFAYYQEFARRHPDAPRLDVVGKNSGSYSPGEKVRFHDEISHEKLAHLYSNCVALIQPSLLESFSLVVLESFLYERPVVVHGGCSVTKEHAQKSNGGLWYDSYEVFEQCLLYLISHPDEVQKLGKNGSQYAQQFRWDLVVQRYLSLI